MVVFEKILYIGLLESGCNFLFENCRLMGCISQPALFLELLRASDEFPGVERLVFSQSKMAIAHLNNLYNRINKFNYLKLIGQECSLDWGWGSILIFALIDYALYKSMNQFQQHNWRAIGMNFNPLNPNYLNQLSFHPKGGMQQKEPQKLNRADTKMTKTLKSNPQDQEWCNNKPKSMNLTAEFVQQHRYLRSNLHYTKEGYLFAFLRKDSHISGRSFIIFPEGIVANCNVINNKLSGWISICKKGEFYNLSHFAAGKFHGLQYAYDIKCGLTIESLYNCGRLQSVKRGIANSQISFERCLNNKELVQLLRSTLSYHFLDSYFPKIDSSLGRYYGSQHKSMPQGLGVLLTDQECFYGLFERGLLSGQGAMIFTNGNSYIGECEAGMMRGYGNIIINGVSQFKLNDNIISERDFNAKRKVAAFQDNYELQSIFSPIVRFYEKLKAIYQTRRKDVDLNQESFVDVQLQHSPNEEEEDPEQQLSLSDSSDPHENVINELLSSNSMKANTPTHISNKEKINQTFGISLTPINNKSKKEELQIIKEQQEKPTTKKTKEKAVLREEEWNQIIEELGEEAISKQDGFLKPKEQPWQVQQQQPIRKNPLNSRTSAQNLTNITDNHPEHMDKLQNQLIGKIIRKN